jgi:hypothetical protein
VNVLCGFGMRVGIMAAAVLQHHNCSCRVVLYLTKYQQLRCQSNAALDFQYSDLSDTLGMEDCDLQVCVSFGVVEVVVVVVDAVDLVMSGIVVCFVDVCWHVVAVVAVVVVVIVVVVVAVVVVFVVLVVVFVLVVVVCVVAVVLVVVVVVVVAVFFVVVVVIVVVVAIVVVVDGGVVVVVVIIVLVVLCVCVVELIMCFQAPFIRVCVVACSLWLYCDFK